MAGILFFSEKMRFFVQKLRITGLNIDFCRTNGTIKHRLLYIT